MNQPGIYGEKGKGDEKIYPRGREGSLMFSDSKGRIWIFGKIISQIYSLKEVQPFQKMMKLHF